MMSHYVKVCMGPTSRGVSHATAPSCEEVDAWSMDKRAAEYRSFLHLACSSASLSTDVSMAVSPERVLCHCSSLSFRSLTLDFREEGFWVPSWEAVNREKRHVYHRKQPLPLLQILLPPLVAHWYPCPRPRLLCYPCAWDKLAGHLEEHKWQPLTLCSY